MTRQHPARTPPHPAPPSGTWSAWRAARTPGRATALIQGAESARPRPPDHLRRPAPRAPNGWRPVCTTGRTPRHPGRLAAADPHRDRAAQPGAGPHRRRTEPGRPALPRPRGRPGAAPHPRRPSSPSRAPGAASTTRAMAHRLAAGLPDPPTVIDAYDTLPDADPAVLPRRPPTTTRSAGSTGRPAPPRAPRASCTPTAASAPPARCLAAALRIGPSDIGSMAFPYAHVAGPDYTVMLLLHGIPALLLEHFALPGSLAAYRRHHVTVAGGSTAFYAALPRRPAHAAPGPPAAPVAAPARRRRRAPCRPRSTTRSSPHSAANSPMATP